jgi:hypothetical protein
VPTSSDRGLRLRSLCVLKNFKIFFRINEKFSEEFKVSVVEEVSETSIRTVTEKYELSERMERRWKAENIK